MKVLINILSDSFNTSTRGLKLHIEESSNEIDSISLQISAWTGSILDLEFQGALLCVSKEQLRKIVRAIDLAENSPVFIVANTQTGGSIAFNGYGEQFGDTEQHRKVVDVTFRDLGGDLCGNEKLKVRLVKIRFDDFHAAVEQFT